jgi:DNA-binding CsgD family transcriptional regulator
MPVRDFEPECSNIASVCRFLQTQQANRYHPPRKHNTIGRKVFALLSSTVEEMPTRFTPGRSVTLPNPDRKNDSKRSDASREWGAVTRPSVYTRLEGYRDGKPLLARHSIPSIVDAISPASKRSSENVEISRHLCLAQRLAAELALALRSSDDPVVRASQLLVSALRLRIVTRQKQQAKNRHPDGHSDSSKIRGSIGPVKAPSLSSRERHILELVGRDLSNKEIARILGIGPETVKSHVRKIFFKLDVNRRFQAVAVGQALGFIERDIPVINTKTC